LLKIFLFTKVMQALILTKPSDTQYHGLQLQHVVIPKPQPGQVVVQVVACALNRRDEWIRQGLYPRIQVGSIMGSDAVGVVTAPLTSSLHGKRVVVCPCQGWLEHKRAPERPDAFHILGMLPAPGTFAEYVCVAEHDVVECPAHLTDAQAAGLPLAGLTAYRAVFTKGDVTSEDTILVTGIGGGVALAAFRLCLAIGAQVFVTSSSSSKIQWAMEQGAAGGVNYTHTDWPTQLRRMLTRPLTHIIDGAGGEAYPAYARLIAPGGRIVCYGSTASRAFEFNIVGVLKNVELLGTSMGSRREFRDMVQFVQDKRVPVDVSHTVAGLDKVEEAFQVMRHT
jgi:NADPH:quinone reductase-like Zn-dependent oxidoreductase